MTQVRKPKWCNNLCNFRDGENPNRCHCPERKGKIVHGLCEYYTKIRPTKKPR